jgi:hypothetical protein
MVSYAVGWASVAPASPGGWDIPAAFFVWTGR